MRTIKLPLDHIRLDGDTQARVGGVNQETVEQYAEAIGNGAAFPAVEVVWDGESYWLTNGFQRVAAYRLAEFGDCDALMVEGDLDHARFLAAAANVDHDTAGLRRSNADKRASVEHALKTKEGVGMSDRALAHHCGVSNQTVRRIREELESDCDIVTVAKRTGTDGREYDTAKISEANQSRTAIEEPGEPIQNSPEEPTDQVNPEESEPGENSPDAPTRDDGQSLNDAYDSAHDSAHEMADIGEQPTDEHGTPLPEVLVDEFVKVLALARQARQQINNANKTLSDIAELTNTFDDILRINRQSASGDTRRRNESLENVYQDIGSRMPNAVCLACAGDLMEPNGDECGYCKGNGWVSSHTHKALVKLRDSGKLNLEAS